MPEVELAGLFTDASGREHGLSIPPPLIRAEVVRELKAHAAEVLPPLIVPVVHAVAQPLLQAISDMESPRMAFGRIALAGDAAFVVRPHVAGGAGKAAMDAACLADCVCEASDVASALVDYERQQLDFGQRIVRHSRTLGAELESRRSAREIRRASFATTARRTSCTPSRTNSFLAEGKFSRDSYVSVKNNFALKR